MPGPSYQQFQGYPNPVQNYFAGRDAGYGRAKEGFGDRQAIETQNALVQQSGAQSYPQYQAQQMQAKQQLEMYGPALQNAIENENYGMRDAIVEALRKTNNPMLGQFADIASTAKKLDKNEYEYDITFKTPEQRSAAYKTDRFLQSAFSSEDLIQMDTPYRVTSRGMPGTPMANTIKFTAVSRASGKPQTQSIEVKDPAQFDELEAQYADNPEAMAAINHARQLFAKSPGGVKVSLPSSTQIGAATIKQGSQAAPKPVAVTSEAQVRPLIADLSPEIAEQVLQIVRSPENKGRAVYFETGTDGKLTGRVAKYGPAPPPNRRRFMQLKGIPGGLFDRDEGKYLVTRRNPSTGQMEKVEMDTLTAQEQEKYWGPELKKLGQAGGTQAVQAYVTADLYKKEVEDLTEIRARIKKNNPAGWSGIQSKMRLVNSLEQMVNLNVGDDPDLAEFVKGTTLLADVLMRAVGGGQGGKWAFELAAKLLDPTLPDNAYQATLDKHLRTLKEKAKQWKGVGKEGSSGFTEKPVIPGLESKPKAPSLDDFIKTRVVAYPQYKTKTRAEWQKAYDIEYGVGK